MKHNSSILPGAAVLSVVFSFVSNSQLSAAGTDAQGKSWPQWRGPLQTGAAPGATPPTTWSETSNVKWKVKIPGDGTATPIIWENLVFVQTAIPTGKTSEASATGKPTGQVNPPPPQGPPLGGDPSRGPGPAGGPGGFGPGTMLGDRMMSQGDKDRDQKLSRQEFTNLAEDWFAKLDTDKSGKLDQEKFVERFGNIMGPPPEGTPEGGRPPGRGGPGRFIGMGFFGATDANKDNTLTAEEFKGTFAKWFDQWDSAKSGSIDGMKLREGLNAALPRPQGGPG